MSLVTRFPDGELATMLLPYLLPPGWRALGRASRAEREAVLPRYREAARLAQSPSTTLREIIGTGDVAAASLRLWLLSGIEVEDLSMPRLVSAAYAWAHYGKPQARGRRPKRRAEHLAQLAAEFSDGPPGRGIQVAMRCELLAVQTAVELGLAIGRGLHEVDLLQVVPADTPGKVEGRMGVPCSRMRPQVEATALMWATRFGVRWVEMLLRLGADPNQVSPQGWTALLYAAVFQSRGIVTDGSTDSGEPYGGYRSRARGVVGPLLDAGASLRSTLPLDIFCALFDPTPVTVAMVGPLEVARAEALGHAGWAEALLEGGRALHVSLV